jgi:hypothetical protein
MAVQAAPGQVVVPAGNGTGATLNTWDSPETVTLDPAPPSGTNRIDLIICDVQSADVGGSGADEFLIHFVKGAEGATPAPPVAPANTVALAAVTVNGGAAAIVQADITDRRPFGLNLGAGRLPPPLAAGAPFTRWDDDTGDVWVAKGGTYGGQWRRAATHLRTKLCRAASVTLGAGGRFPFDTAVIDAYGLFTPANPGILLPTDGYWRVAGGWSSSSAINIGGQYGATIRHPNIYQYGVVLPMSHSMSAAWFAYMEEALSPGDLWLEFIGGGVNTVPQIGRQANYLVASYVGRIEPS